MSESKKFPGIKGSIFLVVIGLILMTLNSIIIGAVIGLVMGIRLGAQGMAVEEITQIVDATIMQNINYVAIGSAFISNLILIAIGIKKQAINLKELLFENKEKVNLKLLAIIGLSAIILPLFVGEIVNFFMHILGVSYSEVEGVSEVTRGVVGIIFGLVLAPIFEEIIFRGIILEGLSTRHSKKVSIVVSALLFSAYHFNLIQLLPTFILGLFLGYVYIKTRSVLVCIYAHFVYNIVPVLLSQIDFGESPSSVPELGYENLILFIISGLIFFGGVFLLKGYFDSEDGMGESIEL
ncbi:CPBP family intramembrane glutamic endopeptidase [Halonatronum saccharophilum]|uniref:CPBP family intramembrane glutamic endopeptidase n=1 Tax=Halonatronum saccharophilum TaxID=150060 RepID=UPI000488C871|nr:type II CAAX endopeptidase family protein [Halonatronum saccharophilum]